MIAGSAVHAALLRDVRLFLHRLSFRLPALSDRAVSHPGARWGYVGGRPVSRRPDLRVRVLGAGHRLVVGSFWFAPSADRGQRSDHWIHAPLRCRSQLPDHAPSGAGARGLLVRAADGVRRVHDQHPSRESTRRRHFLLGTLDDRGDRRGAVDWLLGLSVRMAGALPRNGRAERRHGVHRVEPASGLAACRPGAPAASPADRVAGPRPVVHALPVLVRVRRCDELHRAVRGCEWRLPEGDLPHGTGDRHSVHAAGVGQPWRSVWVSARAAAMPRLDCHRPRAAGVRGHEVVARRQRSRLRRRVRDGLSDVRRLRHAQRQRGPARRRLRRDPGVLRHGHRHRFDRHGMDHRAPRLRGRVRHGGCPGGVVVAVFRHR